MLNGCDSTVLIIFFLRHFESPGDLPFALGMINLFPYADQFTLTLKFALCLFKYTLIYIVEPLYNGYLEYFGPHMTSHKTLHM